jgi:hypothetical protein
MKVEHFITTNKLLLSWQSKNGIGRRYIVGEINKEQNGTYYFQYLYNTEDFKKAEESGFQGHPAFKKGKASYSENALEAFLSRLPPRKRGDFNKYLANHFLPETFDGDGYTLLAHTGAKLPSDGFTLIPDLSNPILPFDYVMEVAGARHHISGKTLNSLQIGDSISFIKEEDNPEDSNAIAIYFSNEKIGYVNRVVCKTLLPLLEKKLLKASILKITNEDERPLIHILIQASEI